MKPPHERALRPDTTLDSPATRGKLPSPERGGQTKNLSVHPSTKTGQLQSLYNHVANKDAVLDGMVEIVVGEFAVPPHEAPWRAALRETARSVHEVLLRHPWAAALVESRLTPSRVRFRYSEAVISTLRRAGFTIELAFMGQLTISSYIYGFTLQEVSWPFGWEELPDVAATLQPRVTPDEHPYLAEMIGWIMQTRVSNADRQGAAAYEAEFEFGLDLILDGLERLRRKRDHGG